MIIPPILEVARRLGSGEPQNGRIQAFWRGGDDFNVSINSARDAWHDFVTGDRGGVLALVEVVLHCDRTEAVAWLETEGFIDPRRSFSAPERRTFSIRREAAREAARDVVSWREALIAELEETAARLFEEGVTTNIRLRAARAARDLYWLNSMDAYGTVRMFVAYRRAEPERTARLVQRGQDRALESRELAAACVVVLANSEADRAA